MPEKMEEQRLTDFQMKIKTDLFVKYESQSRKARTVTELVQILAGIESNEYYLRNLASKGNYARGTTMPDISEKRGRGIPGLLPPNKRFKSDANSTPLQRREISENPQRVCWQCGKPGHNKPEWTLPSQTPEGKLASDEHHEHLKKTGRHSVNMVQADIEAFREDHVSESEN